MASASFGDFGDKNGRLLKLKATCYIIIDDFTYDFRSLPEISDSKQANYNSQTVFGRSSPIRSYSDSGARSISVNFDLYNTDEESRSTNASFLRYLAVAVHPTYEGYQPPPICKFACGSLLSGKIDGDPEPISCLIMDYNISYGRDSIFDDKMMPFHVSGSLNLEVVHSRASLPGKKEVIEGKF